MTFKKITTIIISIIIIIIILSMIKISIDTFDSEIEFREKPRSKKYTHDNIVIGNRKFDFLMKELNDEIDEIFKSEYFNWEKDSVGNEMYKSNITIFKGFESVFYRNIPKNISMNKLIYFPTNSIKLSDIQYFKYNDQCFFPTSNSMLYLEHPLEWIGDRKVNIIISTPN
jgi:hypothetical protein